MIYFESDVAIVSWDAEINGVRLVWKGFAAGEKFRTPLKKGLELLKEKKGSCWFTDQRKLSVLDKDDLIWAETFCTTQLPKIGLKKFALVRSKNKATQTFMDEVEITLSSSPELKINNFDDVEEAKRWLISDSD